MRRQIALNWLSGVKRGDVCSRWERLELMAMGFEVAGLVFSPQSDFIVREA